MIAIMCDFFRFIQSNFLFFVDFHSSFNHKIILVETINFLFPLLTKT